MVAVLAGVASAEPRTQATIAAPVSLPPGSRLVEGRYVLSRGIAEATRAIEQRLKTSGAAFERVGPIRVRGIELVRFLSVSPQTPWLAIHLVRKEGRTFLDVVARPPLTNPGPSR